MADLNDMAQKIKGNVQQVAGDVKMKTGDNVGGAWDKTKGHANEAIANMKMRMDNDTTTDESIVEDTDDNL